MLTQQDHRWSQGRSAIVLILSVLLLLVIACGGGNGENGNGPEPAEFQEFAKQIARAAEEGTTPFFTERVRGETHVCTPAEIEASADADIRGEPLCQNAGDSFEEVLITNYGSRGIVTDVGTLISDVEAFFEAALPDEEDEYGPGSVRLYATAIPSDPVDPTQDLHTAILAAVIDQSGVRGRAVRGIDFEYIDGRWLIPSETTAAFPIAAELLEPLSARSIYDDWLRYEP